jgi:hypothetical protein
VGRSSFPSQPRKVTVSAAHSYHVTEAVYTAASVGREGEPRPATLWGAKTQVGRITTCHLQAEPN